MPQEGRSLSAKPGGLHCTQGHFVPYFGPATWLWIGDAKFCMQCIVERVVPFLDSLGVGRVVETEKSLRSPSPDPELESRRI